MRFARIAALRVAAAGAAGVVLMLAVPASAASGGIHNVQQVGEHLQFVFSAGTNQVDPQSVRVSINGTVVESSARTVDASSHVSRRVVLVIDSSGSMAKGGMQGAQQAALDFLSRVPGDVQVGVVSFSDAPHLLLPPTTDRGRARSVVAALVAAGETTLYDGIRTALSAVGTAGDRRLVLLSDGGDTRSRSRLPEVLAALTASGATADVVAFKTDESATGTLQRIAQAGRGRVVAASGAGDISRAFSTTADELNQQLLVTAAVPAAFAGHQVTLQTTAAGGVKDQVVVLLKATAAAAPPARHVLAPTPPTPTPWWATRPALVLGLASLFLAIVIVLLNVASWTAPVLNGFRRRRHLSVYTFAPKAAPKDKQQSVFGESGVAQTALELAGRIVKRRGIEEKLTQKLERAGVPLTANEFVVVQGSTCLVSFVFLYALVSHGLLTFVAAPVIGYLGPKGWLGFRGKRRHAKFVERLPDALQLAAGSLLSGYSLLQAIDAIVKEGREPVSTEFGRALTEARLGIPIEDALSNVAERMDDRDFRWTVMAIRIQREVGGNLAEVLSTVAFTLRERAALRRQVKALSAEGRLSAYILIALPILMAIYMLTLRRGYIRPLYTQPMGIAMLVFSIILVIGGAFWMKKIVTVEV